MDWAKFNLDHMHKSTCMFGVGWVVAASLKSFQEVLRLRRKKDYEIGRFVSATMDRAKFYLDHIHKSSRIYGVGRVEAASFKPFQQILRWAFWKRRKSEISGFDPAAMDRAKFYLDHLHLEHPHLGCWLGCGRVSQNPKELWRLSSLNYSLRTDQKRNKWIQKIRKMAMDAGRWTQAWTPLLKKGLILTLYKTELEVAHMCPFTDPKLLITSQKPSKPLHRIESKHTNNPFISFLQPGVSILNRLHIRHEDLPYLPHNCFSILWGTLKLRNYLHLFFFFTRRKETKGSPQRMYQHISAQPILQRGGPFQNWLVACIYLLQRNCSENWLQTNHKKIKSHGLLDRPGWSAVSTGRAHARKMCTENVYDSTQTVRGDWIYTRRHTLTGGLVTAGICQQHKNLCVWSLGP